jgi:hypothetical protein
VVRKVRWFIVKLQKIKKEQVTLGKLTAAKD